MILILPRHCLINDPDSSPSLSYIWSWFFPVTVLYMIPILPRHCLIYDPDSSQSLSYIWSWFFPVTVLYMILILPRHALSYIWSWFFPVTVVYMILILLRHALSYIEIKIEFYKLFGLNNYFLLFYFTYIYSFGPWSFTFYFCFNLLNLAIVF
jgi:hypothetical protein